MEDIDIHALQFQDFTAADVGRLKSYYHLRPNKSCDNSALDTFLWAEYYQIQYCVLNESAVLMKDMEVGKPAGCLPLCSAADLPHCFRLQERYFNEVLGAPVRIFFADAEGVELLQSCGALDNYEVTQAEDIRDYIYDAEKMRTLAGKHLSKKRNHIHQFEAAYRGRWEYRKLTLADKGDILAYLNEWLTEKEQTDEGLAVAADESVFEAKDSLDAEVEGIHQILAHPEVFDEIEAGGIYIDGKLKAFSMGSYNPYEKMAVIDIEKADPDIIGLYQVINQQFLIHAFPQAELVNREDDLGLPGLRHAKMSYYPVMFAEKYMLLQKK